MNPSEAKKAGRKFLLRKDWEQIKMSVMAGIVKAKFEQNEELAKKLLATGDAYLEEGSLFYKIRSRIRSHGAADLPPRAASVPSVRTQP